MISIGSVNVYCDSFSGRLHHQIMVLHSWILLLILPRLRVDLGQTIFFLEVLVRNFFIHFSNTRTFAIFYVSSDCKMIGSRGSQFPATANVNVFPLSTGFGNTGVMRHETNPFSTLAVSSQIPSATTGLPPILSDGPTSASNAVRQSTTEVQFL